MTHFKLCSYVVSYLLTFTYLLLLFFWGGSHLWHVEVPRLGGGIRATAAGLHHSHSNATQLHFCDLHHSKWQHQTLNPLREDRDRTLILMHTSWISYH